MLILAAPTGAIENHPVREFLAGLRRDQFATIRGRLARGVADGDLAASPASLDAIARYRVAGQCSALQGGGEGPRWEGRQARAVP